jgi:hypothetical protein
VFTVRLHATGCSLRESQAIPRLIGAERTHQAIWHWVHRLADSAPGPPTASPSRVAADETAVKIDGNWSWIYAAIDLDSRPILVLAPGSELPTDPSRRQRLAGPWWAVDRDRRRQVAVVDAVQDRRQLAFLAVAGDDFLRFSERVECALINKEVLARRRLVEEVVVLVVLVPVPAELRVSVFERRER